MVEGATAAVASTVEAGSVVAASTVVVSAEAVSTLAAMVADTVVVMVDFAAPLEALGIGEASGAADPSAARADFRAQGALSRADEPGLVIARQAPAPAWRMANGTLSQALGWPEISTAERVSEPVAPHSRGDSTRDTVDGTADGAAVGVIPVGVGAAGDSVLAGVAGV